MCQRCIDAFEKGTSDKWCDSCWEKFGVRDHKFNMINTEALHKNYPKECLDALQNKGLEMLRAPGGLYDQQMERINSSVIDIRF